MNPTLLLASVAAAIIGSAQAGYIYIYSPYAATQCQPGIPCAISWHVSHDGPEFERVDIELLSGEAHSARVVAPIVLGYDLAQGNTYLWNVPQGNLAEGEYFIRIKGVGTDYQSYSHSFPIGFESKSTIVPTHTATPTTTASGSTTGVVTPTRTGSAISSISSSIKKSSTAAAGTSSSSAMSVQGSVSIAAAVVAAAFAVMMF